MSDRSAKCCGKYPETTTGYDCTCHGSDRCEPSKLRTKLDRIREIHAPIDAVNTFTNTIRQVCTGCGTDDGNWAVWPCATRRACDE